MGGGKKGRRERGQPDIAYAIMEAGAAHDTTYTRDCISCKWWRRLLKAKGDKVMEGEEEREKEKEMK